MARGESPGLFLPDWRMKVSDTRIAKRAPLTKAIPAGSVGPRIAETLYGRIELVHTNKVIRAAPHMLTLDPDNGNELTNEEAVSAMLLEIKRAEDERRAARKAVALLQGMRLI